MYSKSKSKINKSKINKSKINKTKINKTNKINKTKSTKRQSPNDSATSYPEGTIMKGNDGNRWVIKKASNGVPRWVSIESVEINGIRLLTTDILAKNIGKSITIYEREYSELFPKVLPDKADPTMTELVFIPSADAEIKKGTSKKILPNWLKTQTPAVKSGDFIEILGMGNWYNKDNELSAFFMQIDSKRPQIVSSRVMNTEAFIKIHKHK